VRDCRDIESALFIFEVLHSEECPKTEKCPVRNGKLDAKYANVPLKEGGFALEWTHESGVINVYKSDMKWGKGGFVWRK
jgi:hypothetical protein